MLLRDLSSTPECSIPAPRGEIAQQGGPSRHDLRIARILALGDLLGRSMSISYLDSCDVRALPVILERLEAEYRRRARRSIFRGLLPRGHARERGARS